MALSLLKRPFTTGDVTVCILLLADNNHPSCEQPTGRRGWNYVMVSSDSQILL